MKTLVLGIFLTVTALNAAPSAADKRFEAAAFKENVQGDLRGAIGLYQKMIADFGKDRAVAAKALLRMADCHRKLGDAESRKLLERIVREYSDQKDTVSEAHSRLASLDVPATAGIRQRQLWSDAPSFGNSVSADGRWLPYIDWSSGEVMLRDLRAGVSRNLTQLGGYKKAGGGAETALIAPDGSWVAFLWHNTENDGFGYQLRIIGTDGKGLRTLISRMDHVYRHPRAISPDGKWIAMNSNYQRGDNVPTAVTLVSVETGAIRDLITSQDRVSFAMAFSPDGKWLAYSSPRADAGRIGIYAAPVAGTGPATEKLLLQRATSNRVMGWAADGSGLLFLSESASASDLQFLPIRDGAPTGEPRQIRSMPREGVQPLGVTAQGTLIYGSSRRTTDAYAAALSSDGSTIIGEPKPVVPGRPGITSGPRWTPDSRKLMFAEGGDRWVIRSATGQETRMLIPIAESVNALWAPDGTHIIASGTAHDGQRGIFRIAPATGEYTTLLTSEGRFPPFRYALSPDGRTLYYAVVSRPRVLARDLGSGTEKILHEERGDVGVRGIALSPDGSELAILPYDERSPIRIVQTATGTTRDLTTASIGRDIAWSADGRHLLVVRPVAKVLVKIPLAGGEIVTQSIGPRAGGITVSADGKQLGFTRTQYQAEVWALENLAGLLK